MILRRVLLGVVVFALTISLTLGYSTGAPESVCNDMKPLHDVPPQTTSPPYSITFSPNTYTPGGPPINVTIQASGPNFKGFLLTARYSQACQDQTSNIGTFIQAANTNRICSNHAITHSTNDVKTSVTVQWTPPPNTQGPLEFRATVVQVKATFWINVKSSVISDSHGQSLPCPSSTIAPATTTTQPPTGQIVKDSACGVTKGCFSNCPGDCTFLMSWISSPSPDKMIINLKAKLDNQGTRYAAFGLSSDLKMGSDSVTECVVNGNTASVYNSYNEGNKNTRIDPTGVVFTNSSFTDGIFSCTFTQEKAAGINNQRFSLSDKYYLFFATGPAQSNGIYKHDRIPPASSYMVSTTDTTVDVSSSPIESSLVKAHGSLMLIAWILSASIGLVLARYYKPVWPTSTWFGQKIWFQIHRGCMVLCLLTTCIAFIIIFVEAEGYSQISGEGYKKAHPILGIIVTGLCVINPIMALFRPHPGTPKRPIFNWAHWGVGTSAYILGVVTIFFGIELEKASAPEYMKYVLAAFVIWQGLVQIALEIIQILAQNPRFKRNAYEMSEPHGTPSKAPVEENDFLSKRVILYLHIAVVTGFTIALIVILNVKEDD